MTITSVPVLTGEAGRKFEAEAKTAYEHYLHRNETEEKNVTERYERGMRLVRAVMEKSKMGIL